MDLVWGSERSCPAPACGLPLVGPVLQRSRPRQSLWIDPELDVYVALLTNRVHPTRANETIKAFRPVIHDAIVAALDG